jgi:hypothetical protein
MCRVSILFGNGCNELALNNDASQYFLAGSHNHEEEKSVKVFLVASTVVLFTVVLIGVHKTPIHFPDGNTHVTKTDQ